jgi:mannose-6-phosphate isomerase-like protein (cupin superfamily)
MPLIDTRSLAVRDVKPGWHGCFFDSEAMSFALYEIDAGATLHEHCHPNEEVWNVLSGELEITIGADTFRAVAGTSALVPPNTAHSVRALAASSALIVDHPLRAAVGGAGRAAFAVEFPQAELAGPLALVLRNQGGSSGTLLAVELESRLAANLPEARATVIPTGELPRATVLASGATLALDFELPTLTQRERLAVQARELIVYVRGAVFYADGAGRRHHSTFCRVFEPGTGFVLPPRPGYNYGD